MVSRRISGQLLIGIPLTNYKKICTPIFLGRIAHSPSYGCYRSEALLVVVEYQIIDQRAYCFAGPTGTGKTETAKALARNIFGDESCCLRFDMAEYKQSHSRSRDNNAPPGYIGYEAGGQLTNAVRDNPFSIILFDEIEKAHPSILDKFFRF
ncbi:MAG: AAA family ATPase [Lachnospiraceae bacterium]